MNKLKELRLIVKMNERLGVETDPSVFDQIIAEEQKEQKQLALQEERKAVFKSTFADLSSQISKLMAEEKQKTAEEQALLDRFANVLTKIDEIKSNTSSDEPQVTIAEVADQGQQEVVQEAAILAPIEEPSLAKEAAKKIAKDAPPSMFVQPEPAVTSRDLKDIQQKLKLMEGWVSKISMAGPGGGAGSVDELDHNTISVVSDSYTVGRRDYYVGIDYPGPVTITLPVDAKRGRPLVIKDESGNSSTNPITVSGMVDNDPGGFILQMDNGAIQLIYQNGWRII